MERLLLKFFASIAVLSTVCGFAFVYASSQESLPYFINSDDPLDFQYPNNGISSFRCDLPDPLDPSKDGLLSSKKLFSGPKAIEAMVKRHQPLVRIPSVCYDDLGDFDEDERWKPFEQIPHVMEETYPNIYKYAKVETINRLGLVYTVQGSDESLAPILLTAHLDVGAVDEDTLDQWEHPPFDAFYDKTDGYLWGRGASEKSRITALMSALEALLSQEDYNPHRSVVLAFGFDEECSGSRGAGQIAKSLEERYGKNGIAVILDEGGGGLQSIGDTLYALPAVYEKGYLDVWLDLDVLGGDNSKPTPHTSIGIMSEIVVNLESNPFKPQIAWNDPIHQGLICLARYSPRHHPELTQAVYRGNLKRAAQIVTEVSRDTQYFIQTSQAINWVAGGQKVNALPEFATLGVNHRYAPQDSIGGIQHRIARLAENIARKYKIRLEAFKGDKDYDEYLAAEGISRNEQTSLLWEPIYNGSLVLEARKRSYITPQSPTKGAARDTFAGTVRYTYADDALNVVPATGAMTGYTDSRYYISLSNNIYRWDPGSLKSFGNIHKVNERLLMSEHVNMARFYYDFVRNFDKKDL